MKRLLLLSILAAVGCKKPEYTRLYASFVKPLATSGSFGEKGSRTVYYLDGLHYHYDWIKYSTTDKSDNVPGYIMTTLYYSADSSKNIAYRMLDTLDIIEKYQDIDTTNTVPVVKERYNAAWKSIGSGFYWRFYKIEYYIENEAIESQISKKAFIIYNPDAE